MYIPGITNKWFERFMLVVLTTRAQFVRHTNLSECCVRLDLRSILNVILWVNLVRGCRGVLFLLWNLIGPDGTLGSPFACFERFYESSCLLCVVVMMMVMIELPPSISQNRRYESTVSGNRTRVFEYTPVQDAPGSINARILIMDEISRRCNFRSDEFERFEWWTLGKVVVVVEVYIFNIRMK